MRFAADATALAGYMVSTLAYLHAAEVSVILLFSVFGCDRCKNHLFLDGGSFGRCGWMPLAFNPSPPLRWLLKLLWLYAPGVQPVYPPTVVPKAAVVVSNWRSIRRPPQGSL